MVGVAQLVEHLVVAQVAVGSSPITHPIKKNARFLTDPGIFFNTYNQTYFAWSDTIHLFTHNPQMKP